MIPSSRAAGQVLRRKKRSFVIPLLNFSLFQFYRQIQTVYDEAFVYDRSVSNPYLVFARKGRYNMKTISKEYLLLFNTISDVEETLRQLQESLVAAQRQAEELFLDTADAPPESA